MERELCDAAIRGSVESLREIIEKDELILDRVVVGCFNAKSPLHVATSCKQTEFVEKLLHHKPGLAQVLDSHLGSALHLASAQGHIDIVKLLTTASPEMCLVRDRDGKIPLHIAAEKGNVDVLSHLLEASPKSARVRLHQDGSNVLHLSIKHNQFESLKRVLLEVSSHDLVNAKDNDGNTMLHLAVLHKHRKIIKHLVKNSNIEVNATNANGQTAMDIIYLENKESDSKALGREIEVLREAKAKRAKDLIHGKWLSQKRDSLMVVASLIATMAFQAGVNPPGGFWQEDVGDHKAGEAIIASQSEHAYPYFLRCNTIGFFASLSTILLLISGLPFKKKAFMWILVVIMWLAITSMALSYLFASFVVTPEKERRLVVETTKIAVIVWCGVMALLLLLHTVRLILGFLEEQGIKAIQRIVEIISVGTKRKQSNARPNAAANGIEAAGSGV